MRVLFILLCLISIQSQAQVESEQSWKKTFGSELNDEISSIKQTSDNGYIAAGSIQLSNGDYNAWLIKTDAEGNQQWEKNFGGALSDKANCVQKTSDGGYILAGFTSSYGSGEWDAWLIKTDESGNEEWNKYYGGAGYDLAHYIIQTADGGYVVCGDYYSSGNLGYSDGWIFKIDADGDMIWEKTYGNTGDEFIFEVQELTDNNLIFSGTTDPLNSTSDDRDFWLLKTDVDGNKIWNKTYDGAGNRDFCHGTIETPNGGYISIGNIRHEESGKREIWLLKTTVIGEKEWAKVLSDGNDALGRSIQPTSDGGYIIAGFIDFSDYGDMDFCLIKLDKDFNKEWLKGFGNKNAVDEGWESYETNDGGFVVGGFITQGAYNTDAFIVKTDSEGNVNLPISISSNKKIKLKNYPNPCISYTTIEFELVEQSKVRLCIYDAIGQFVQELENSVLLNGMHSFTFHSENIKSGVYFYTLETNKERISKRIIVL